MDSPAGVPLPASRIGSLLRRPMVQLGLVLALGASLRLYRLGSNPPGLFCDEVAIAANARSLGLTGKNLSGDVLPLYCEERSFGFWGVKGILYQPVYVYASVPTAVLLGNSPFSARLPSVMFGLLAIVGTWLLVHLLFNAPTALAASFLLAVSPWHLHFSRIAFEAISLPAILAFAAWALHRGLESRRHLVMGAALMGMATYAYPVAKLFAPLLLLVFIAIHMRKLRAERRNAILALVLLLVVVAPNLYLIVSDRQQERVHETVILSGHLEGEHAVGFLKERAGRSGWAAAVLERRGFLVPFVFAYNYISYFSPEFLFVRGDVNPRHGLPDRGMCPYYLAPLLLAGIVALLMKWRDERSRFLLGWVLLYPVAASMTVESPHAIRSITGLPLFEILAAVGLRALLGACRLVVEGVGAWRSRAAGAALAVAFIGFPFNLSSYLEQYYKSYPVYSAAAWQTGVLEALDYARSEKRGQAIVWVTPEIHNAYLYVLFTGTVDFRAVNRSGDLNARLVPFDWGVSSLPKFHPGDLWVATFNEQEGRNNLERLREFPFPDGSPNLVVCRAR